MKALEELDVQFGDIRVPRNIEGGQLWPKIDILRIGYGVFYTQLPYLPTLKYLIIDNTTPLMKLNNIMGTSVSKYAETLEYLRFCPGTLRDIDIDEATTISKLRALKRLDCQLEDNFYIDHFITKLNQLEELILQNSYITNSGIIILLGHCKKLRRLDLFACHNITKDVVLPAVAILKMNGVQTDNPLVITVGDEFGATNESLWCGVLVIKKHTQFSWNLL
ncbi:uncharacterized protein LOC128257362 [Drosophila gunungcola]|uniref:uncharacterized protein LOC128257362 n=1 Tax=Drosophila gunungcola TaxID=103775 RepID=UPI0022E57A49|nr:uncharacterized protein LOC128257362 [Drosophila gunungcola]